MELRDLPSVDELARESRDPLAVGAARAVLARAREEILAGGDPGDLAIRFRDELAGARAPSLRRVINATGVIVHTNLGRAPLAAEALDRVHAAIPISSTTSTRGHVDRDRNTSPRSCDG